MVRIFSVRILAVGSHRQFAVCGSHFRVRQFAVRILEQPFGPQLMHEILPIWTLLLALNYDYVEYDYGM